MPDLNTSAMPNTNMPNGANPYNIAVDWDAHPLFTAVAYMALRWNLLDKITANLLLTEWKEYLEDWQVQWLHMLIGGNPDQLPALIDVLYREYELWLPSQSSDEAQI